MLGRSARASNYVNMADLWASSELDHFTCSLKTIRSALKDSVGVAVSITYTRIRNSQSEVIYLDWIEVHIIPEQCDRVRTVVRDKVHEGHPSPSADNSTN